MSRRSVRRNTAERGDFKSDFARKLAQQLNALPEDFRYVEISYFDGPNWTHTARWEQRKGSRWVEVPWVEIQF